MYFVLLLTAYAVIVTFMYLRVRRRVRTVFSVDSTRQKDFRSEFVANVSHELRTPLTSISGYLETLLETEELSRAERRRFLERMQGNSDRLKCIVEDLLVLSELEAHPEGIARQWVSFEEIVSPVVENISGKLRLKGQTIEVINRAGSVNVDPFRIEQVLRNLVENAHRYSGENTRIEIIAEKRDGILILSVKDNGAGIEPAHLPRLFERFYRVDKARSRELGGSGLGLAICKHIVQSHQGMINVSSELKVGTEFVITIPLSSRETLTKTNGSIELR